MTTLWSAPVVAVVVFVGALTMGYGARMVQAGHEDSSLCADRWAFVGSLAACGSSAPKLTTGLGIAAARQRR